MKKMKIIKEFKSMGMKHIQYDGNDAEEIKKRFKILKHQIVDRLCVWLLENNEVVDAIDCYDSQSGWQGTDFKIGKANLSFNGYCLSNSSVELFLNGGKDPKWFNFWEPEYDEAKKWLASNGL